MNKSLRFLTALAAFGAAAVLSHAQSAPKIFVIDMAKLYDSHFKTEEQNNKLKNDEQSAQVELEKLNKEGNALVEQYKELDEQSKNPALSNDAKAKAESDKQSKLEEIQRKQNEVQAFRANTQRSLQQRVQQFRTFLLEEISKVAVDIAKKKGASLLVDKSGPTLIGISNVLYFDPSYDITDEVLAVVNKDRPAGSAAPAARPASTAPAAPASSDAPTVTFPGAKK